MTLDVANAFNSASWEAIYRELIEKIVAEYIIKLLRNYLTDREVRCGNGWDNKLTSGVPQDSVLGLWGVMYDSLLCLRLPEA